MSLLKHIDIAEGWKFVLKVDATDIFNRHRQAYPDTQPADTSYGCTGLCGTFGVPTYTDYGPRNLQISGRITF
jgi:hypothetical protein